MTDVRALHQQIINLFSEKLNLEVPSVDTDLVEAGLLDSLAFVDLIVSLEQEFGVNVAIDEIEIDNFRSIARIAEFVVVRTELQRVA